MGQIIGAGKDLVLSSAEVRLCRGRRGVLQRKGHTRDFLAELSSAIDARVDKWITMWITFSKTNYSCPRISDRTPGKSDRERSGCEGFVGEVRCLEFGKSSGKSPLGFSKRADVPREEEHRS